VEFRGAIGSRLAVSQRAVRIAGRRPVVGEPGGVGRMLVAFQQLADPPVHLHAAAGHDLRFDRSAAHARTAGHPMLNHA